MDAAKRAANINLLSDDFSNIPKLVNEGRVMTANSQKIVYNLFGANAGELGIFMVSSLIATPSPMTTLGILMLNLLTDTISIFPLALDRPLVNLMTLPPKKPDAPILTKFLLTSIILQVK